MDRTFAALADPTRRGVLARLRDEPGLSVSELARPFGLKLPGMMKHLDSLSDAGLIRRTKSGRTVAVYLSAEPMREAMAWLQHYERFWTASLDRLVALVEEEEPMSEHLPSLTLVRRIKAPPAKVYAALTQPDLMIRWWGPDAGPTLSAEADVRPGGRFSIVFRLLNGEELNPTGVYREVVPDRKLVFTWEWRGEPQRESLVSFLLEPFDGGTELTLIHERLADEEARKSHEAGWNGLLDKLVDFVAGAQARA